MVVLLADDNRILLSVLAMVLRGEGHDVLAADSGRKALALATEKQPDAAIIDLHMPIVSGQEVAAHCKSLDVPFVFISAYDEAEIKTAAQELGARGYLLKPTTRAAMVNAIGRCAESGAADASRCE